LFLVCLPLQARLAPIAAAFSMDPVERALRVGGEREVAKKTEEEAGTIAGVNKLTVSSSQSSLHCEVCK
jgi:hypothetical protein